MMFKRDNYGNDCERKRRRYWSNSEKGRSRSRSIHRWHGLIPDNANPRNPHHHYHPHHAPGNQHQFQETFGIKANRYHDIRRDPHNDRLRRDFFQSNDRRYGKFQEKAREEQSCLLKYASKNNPKSSSVRNHSSSHIKDDKDGHLIIHKGDWIESRYKVHSLLGEGTFCKCLEVYDKKRESMFALKVVKNIEHYRESARIEIKILKRIAQRDPHQKKLCIPLLSSFDYHGHICLLFPKLGKSVFQFLRENLYQPYTMSQVQHIAHQLLTAVKFLHEMNLTHTDLKPENMLFIDSSFYKIWSENAQRDIYLLRNSEIRLIDFGSATFDDEYHSTVVSTRHYRAPEVILESGWSHPCDMWSCGCIIFELFTGNTLFKTHDNKEHLAMMEHILGPIPVDMVNNSKKPKYFDNGAIIWDSQNVKENCKTLKEYINLSHYNYAYLYDILKQMLSFNPAERITAADALVHPFFDSFKFGNPNCSR